MNHNITHYSPFSVSCNEKRSSALSSVGNKGALDPNGLLIGSLLYTQCFDLHQKTCTITTCIYGIYFTFLRQSKIHLLLFHPENHLWLFSLFLSSGTELPQDLSVLAATSWNNTEGKKKIIIILYKFENICERQQANDNFSMECWAPKLCLSSALDPGYWPAAEGNWWKELQHACLQPRVQYCSDFHRQTFITPLCKHYYKIWTLRCTFLFYFSTHGTWLCNLNLFQLVFIFGLFWFNNF